MGADRTRATCLTCHAGEQPAEPAPAAATGQIILTNKCAFPLRIHAFIDDMQLSVSRPRPDEPEGNRQHRNLKEAEFYVSVF